MVLVTLFSFPTNAPAINLIIYKKMFSPHRLMLLFIVGIFIAFSMIASMPLGMNEGDPFFPPVDLDEFFFPELEGDIQPLYKEGMYMVFFRFHGVQPDEIHFTKVKMGSNRSKYIIRCERRNNEILPFKLSRSIHKWIFQTLPIKGQLMESDTIPRPLSMPYMEDKNWAQNCICIFNEADSLICRVTSYSYLGWHYPLSGPDSVEFNEKYFQLLDILIWLACPESHNNGKIPKGLKYIKNLRYDSI